VRLLEISNTYRILNCIKPEASDVYAVHEDVQLSKKWLETVVLPGSGLYNPDTNSYLLSAALQSTGQIEWREAKAG
jgi:hypothetical protein